MYHINKEGKIYPCRARVMKCPYGSNMHATTKEELYHKILREEYSSYSVPLEVDQELYATGRIRSLHSLSSSLEQSSHPLETIILTLNYAIIAQTQADLDNLNKRHAQHYFDMAFAIRTAILKGVTDGFPDWTPDEIMNKALKMVDEDKFVKTEFLEEGIPNEVLLERIYDMEVNNDYYVEYKNYRLTKDNYNDNMQWLKEDFYQFSHDFNTSKMLTQPIFYGNLKKAKETIASLNNDELLSAYDDYLVSDEEILNSIKLADYFNYEFRNDLSIKANEKVQNWYDMNRKLAKNWEKNKAKRILLSLELAKELDKRGLSRQDKRMM